MIIIWGAIGILCLMAEFLNRKCAYIWFSISSFFSLITFNFINNYVLSFVVFLIGGFILLVIFREYTINKVNNYNEKRVINKKGIVVKVIEKKNLGKIKIGRKVYNAKAKKTIKKGKNIVVTGYNNHIVEVVEAK